MNKKGQNIMMRMRLKYMLSCFNATETIETSNKRSTRKTNRADYSSTGKTSGSVFSDKITNLGKEDDFTGMNHRTAIAGSVNERRAGSEKSFFYSSGNNNDDQN
jgi:hypothetical protein